MKNPIDMTKVRAFVEEDFDLIPASLIRRAYYDDPWEFEEITPFDDDDLEPESWLPMWGDFFRPDKTMGNWILGNLETVKNCGFRIYETKEEGVFLGVDGAGYSFLHEHFMPLYQAVYGEEMTA